jgi:alkaline phosphatase D
MPSINRRDFLKVASLSGSAAVLNQAARLGPRRGSFVISAWSGGLTTTSIRVNARIDHDSATVRLHISTDPGLSNPLLSTMQTSDQAANNRMVGWSVSGLSPGVLYYYGVESGGNLDAGLLGRFKTPAQGPQSFSFAFASCANTGSSHAVFDTVRSLDPLFFIHMGDMHYEDISVNDRDEYREAFDAVLGSPAQSALYLNQPLAYMWDDHDYGPNDSNAASPGREAARLTYQEYIPHYPLEAGSGDVPVYQSFAIGRIFFILTDCRSERSNQSDTDNASKTMLGAAQKAWFKERLKAANGLYAAIIWVNTIAWIGPVEPGEDHWSGYTTERKEIANFIKDEGIKGLVILSGDAHMLAIDDGTNSDYADGGGAALPVIHAAALDRSGVVIGGPYSHGTFPGPGQFGLCQVTDTGDDSVELAFSGRDVNNASLVSLTLVHDCCEKTEKVFLPIAARP